MDEVKEKIDSGRYRANFDANIEDYQRLLKLCKADAQAQREIVMQNGRVVGLKKEKLENITNIERVFLKHIK